MNSASGHLFLPKNKYQESQMKFEEKKRVKNVPVNKDLLTGTHPVNKELLTGTHPVNKELLTRTFRSIRNY